MSRAILWLLFRRHRASLFLALLLPVAIGCVLGNLYPQLAPERRIIESLSIVKRFLGRLMEDPLAPEAFMTMVMRHPLCQLLYALLPAVPVLGLLARERGRGGLDLLLSTPLTRRRLVWTAAVFVVILLPFLLLALLAGVFAGAVLAGVWSSLPHDRYVLAALPALGLSIFWGGVALVVGVAARDGRQGTLIFVSLVVVAFAVDSTAHLAPSVEWLSRWTPYGYFQPVRIVRGQAAWLPGTVGLALAGLVLAVIAAEVEERRRNA